MPEIAQLIGGAGEGASRGQRVATELGGVASRIASRAVLRTLVGVESLLAGSPAPPAPARKESKVGLPARRRKATVPEPVQAESLVTLRRPDSGARAGARDLPRIFLLNPPRYRGIPVTRLFRSEYLFVQNNQVPAMDLAYFAAAARGRAHLCLVDANGEDLTNDQVLQRMIEFRPDVIVQKGVLNILHHDLAAARAYEARSPEVRVVLSCRGAIGMEGAVFEDFPFVDALARGEIDAFARDIAERPDLRDIEGVSVPGRHSTTIRVVEDLDEHPIPDLEQMPRLWYSGFNLAYYGVPSGYFLTTSRGCPYTCTFCMVGGIDGRPFRHRKRDPKNVAEEARLARDRYGVRDYYVFDEIFTMPGHGERVCEAWLEDGLGAQWICEGKPDLVTLPMLSTMKRAGCLAVYYGVESGDDGILQGIEKGHTTADARRALALTRQAGILAGAYIMLGFPGETMQTYLRTVRFLLETRPDLLRYDLLLPYPVTVLHREMVQAGLLEGTQRGLDRRISPHHDEPIRYRSTALGPRTLKAMELLLKQGFRKELRSSPRPMPVARA